MIDPADQQKEKKRRGRPATGKAMTPAEKQRAYRERAKAQQAGAIYTRDDMTDAVRIYNEEIVKLTDELNAALTRAEKAERSNKGNVTKVKRHRDDTPSVLKQYNAQSWDAKTRKWRTIGDSEPDNQPFVDWKEAEEFVKGLLTDGSKSRYRIVPANLPIIEYK